MRNGDVAVLAGMTLEELAMRVDRLEKHVISTANPARMELAGMKAQLATAPPETLRALSVKGEAVRTRFFGQSSTRVMVNLVSAFSRALGAVGRRRGEGEKGRG